ncbi:MAG TPA: phosphatase, partial [Cyanobacteria bacterium UBA11049]|nr:phosphatase [Cyanobacteria bacterium UBA11049]
EGKITYEDGWVMHVTEDGNEPTALTFHWQILAMGGEPAEGGAGFSNPDNLLADRNGNLWVVTDMTSSKDLVGNNSIWYIPTTGANAGKAYLFGIGPIKCETTGSCFTTDEQTILSIQHPKEGHGIRRDRAIETQEVTITTAKGEKFQQIRFVPVGSTWVDKSNNAPPKPGVVAIQRYR